MDIKDAHIGQWVRTIGGVTGKIAKIDESGYVTIGNANNTPPTDYVACIDNVSPVSDPCTDCQKIASMNKCCEYWKSECETARRSRDEWEATAYQSGRNAAYWREELTKLQNDALAECKPLAEVAKIYVKVSPDKLLMSQAARRIIEYLAAIDRPLYIGGIMEGMKDIMAGMAIMDGIMEARDAGKIALVNGKYEIVRD